MVRLQPQSPYLERSALAAALLTAALATAQPPVPPAPQAQSAPTPARSSRDPVQIVDVEWGQAPSIGADRWTTLRVWLTSEQAWSGELRVQYAQDATQEAVTVIPVATTPGRNVPFELPICLSRGCDEVKLSVSSGRRGIERRFSAFAPPSQDKLPDVLAGQLRVAVVGEISALECFAATSSTPDAFEVSTDRDDTGKRISQPKWWQLAVAADIKPSALPIDWMCLESFDLVIATADAVAGLEPRRRDALLTWVRAGGRLVLAVDQGGSHWSQVLRGESPVQISDPIPLQPPTAPAALLPALPNGLRTTVSSVNGRLLSLRESGARDGWRILWPLADDPTNGLGAVGPLGMGTLAYLGLDPATIPAIKGAANTRILWLDLLGGDGHGLLHSLIPTDADQENQYEELGSRRTSLASAATNALLDRASSVPPIGLGSVLVVVSAVGILALLLGPVDRLVLTRRSMLHRSWITALGWIGAGSAAAFVAPLLVRSGESTLSRAVVQDVLCTADGPGPSWESGVTGFFAGRPGTLEIAPERDGTWWRGVSALGMYGGSAGRTLAPVAASPRTSESGPRELVPHQLRMGQWTYRTLLSQTPETAPDARTPFARVRRLAGGDLEVRVLNLPADARLVRSALQIDGKVLPLSPSPDPDAPGRWIARTPIGELSEAAQWQPSAQWNEYELGVRSGSRKPGMAFGLPMVLDRSDALDARIRTGGWACVLLECESGDVGLPNTGFDGTKTNGVRYLRLLCPIAEGSP